MLYIIPFRACRFVLLRHKLGSAGRSPSTTPRHVAIFTPTATTVVCFLVFLYNLAGGIANGVFGLENELILHGIMSFSSRIMDRLAVVEGAFLVGSATLLLHCVGGSLATATMPGRDLVQ